MIGEFEVTPGVAGVLLQLTVCAFTVYLLWCVVRYIWTTRRRRGDPRLAGLERWSIAGFSGRRGGATTPTDPP